MKCLLKTLDMKLAEKWGKFVKRCSKNKLWNSTKNLHFPGFAQKICKQWMKLTIFFGLIFKFGALMVSEMGCYDLKCEKAIITAS